MKAKSNPVRPEPHLVGSEAVLPADTETEEENILEGKTRPKDVPESISWGEPPSDSGGPAVQVEKEDESENSERLIRKGLDAAETSRRKSAEIGRADQTRL